MCIVTNERRSSGRRWGRWVALVIGVILAISLLLGLEIVETSWLTDWYTNNDAPVEQIDPSGAP